VKKSSKKKNKLFREWLKGVVGESGESEEAVMRECGISGPKEDWELVGEYETEAAAIAAMAEAEAEAAA
jgi:hypothetical protein